MIGMTDRELHPPELARSYVLDDAEAFWPVVSRSEFPKQMSWAAHTDKRETVEFIEGQIAALANGTELTWAIERDAR